MLTPSDVLSVKDVSDITGLHPGTLHDNILDDNLVPDFTMRASHRRPTYFFLRATVEQFVAARGGPGTRWNAHLDHPTWFDDDMLSSIEAVRYLGISMKRMRYLLRDHKLIPDGRLRGRVYFYKPSLDAYIEENEEPHGYSPGSVTKVVITEY